jgi:hypothetical protein
LKLDTEQAAYFTRFRQLKLPTRSSLNMLAYFARPWPFKTIDENSSAPNARERCKSSAS